MARPKSPRLHFRTDEVVPLHSGVSSSQRRNNKVQELKNLQAGACHRKREDVLASLQRMVIAQSLDVAWVIEHAVAFELNRPRVVLAKTL